MGRLTRWMFAAAVLLLGADRLRAGSLLADWNAAAETVVVYNTAMPESKELAEYYAAKRGIAGERLVGIECTREDSVSRAEFENSIRLPLLKTFQSRDFWKVKPATEKDPGPVVERTRVRVLVLMHGVPFQVRRDQASPQASKEDEASVDSELVLLGVPPRGTAGPTMNPYDGQSMRFHQFQAGLGMLLVGRLDGPTPEIVKRMIDDAIATEDGGLLGRAVIDMAKKDGAYARGEKWLGDAVKLFQRRGVPVWMDGTVELIRSDWPLPDTAFYFGWYASDVEGVMRSAAFRFRRGAVACHIHSYSAGALRAPDRGWVGPLLARGAAVALGNVYEPYLTLTTHPDRFAQRLLDGFTVAEAAWGATPVVSWMSVVVGDPLYRPYAKGAGARLGEGVDRDYAMFQGMHLGGSSEGDAVATLGRLKTLAVSRGNPHLLELAALLAESHARPTDALKLVESAESMSPLPADQLRLRLYRAQWLSQAGRQSEAVALVRTTLADPKFAGFPAKDALRGLLAALGG